jgi:hypothetical protein
LAIVPDGTVVVGVLDVEEPDLPPLVLGAAGDDLERATQLLAARARAYGPLAFADDRLPHEAVGLDRLTLGQHRPWVGEEDLDRA